MKILTATFLTILLNNALFQVIWFLSRISLGTENTSFVYLIGKSQKYNFTVTLKVRLFVDGPHSNSNFLNL